MKKIAIILALFYGLSVNTEAQEIPAGSDLFQSIRDQFITEWSYFRMRRNPLLTYEETHTEYGWWKRPSQVKGILPDTFYSKNYNPDIKIYRWEDIYKRPTYPFYEQVRNPFWFVIEKGDGLTGISTNIWTDEILDTIYLNIYDSIFPYDNRFLVEYDENNERQKFKFYSGNIAWEPLRAGIYPVASAGFIRGVQFGVELVKELNSKMIDSLRRIRPEYPDYVYAIAEKSFLSKGSLLIAGHEKTVSDYIEYIFYTGDPEKTGGKENEYYEMRYVLPTNIGSITQRRIIKRKLSEEELNIIWRCYLRSFIEDRGKFESYMIDREDVIDEEVVGTGE